MTTEPTRSTTSTNGAGMSNQDRAIAVIMDANEGVTEGDVSRIVELPEPDAWGTWDVNGLEINSADKDGVVLIEWEEESDYAYYGTQTRTLCLNRQQVLAIIAATNFTEEQK